MMRIAICEDNQQHADILEKLIRRWAEQEKIEVTIRYYKSAESYLFYMEDGESYDLAFLDIELGNMNGLELAKLIRRKDTTMFLVFTTGSRNYAVKGYEVSAFQYLVKPLEEKDLVETLNKIHRQYKERKNDVILVNNRDGLQRIEKCKIRYISANDHYVVLHLKDEEVEFKANLKDVEQQFKEPQFCKNHRSYIVNLHYVKKISKDEVMLERTQGKEEKLPLSRANKDNLNRCYVAYYTK